MRALVFALLAVPPACSEPARSSRTEPASEAGAAGDAAGGGIAVAGRPFTLGGHAGTDTDEPVTEGGFPGAAVVPPNPICLQLAQLPASWHSGEGGAATQYSSDTGCPVTPATSVGLGTCAYSIVDPRPFDVDPFAANPPCCYLVALIGCE